MRIVLATSKVPFVTGGAENLVEELEAALRRSGHEADTIALPFKWYPAAKILDHMLVARMVDLTEASGQPVDLLIGLKFPAYFVRHPNKVLWLMHQHRSAYDLWAHPQFGDLLTWPKGRMVRNTIHQADRALLPEAHRIFTISQRVSSRLSHYCDVASTPLYHPPKMAERFHAKASEDYLYYPSRLSPLKRQDLVIRALAHTQNPVVVAFAGAPDSTQYGEELQGIAREAGVADRVRWLGRVTEEEKIDQYSRCLGVVFPPWDEDYGYITLEAMLSKKPVLTCSDSGGTLEFVVDGKTGLVTEPDPEALAAAMDHLWENRGVAAEWGATGLARYHQLGIAWDRVIRQLTTPRGLA